VLIYPAFRHPWPDRQSRAHGNAARASQGARATAARSFGGVTAVRDMADDIRLVGELAREARFGEIPAPDIAYVAVFAGRPSSPTPASAR
jgi:hypothetical protein